MFNHIVIAIDGSDHSTNAVRVACDLAKHYDSRLSLVTAPQMETTAFAMGAVAGYHAIQTAPTHDELMAAGQKITDAALSEVTGAGLEADAQVLIGDAATHVVAVAEKTGADLIVCGRRGLGAVTGMFLGSTSQKIQARATCAVLTVE